MKREQILARLSQTFKNEKPEDLAEVAYNLSLANAQEASLESRAGAALERLRQRGRSPLDSEILTQAQREGGKFSSCPICRTQMRVVSLLEDRKAWYCETHRICVPVPVEGA